MKKYIILLGVALSIASTTICSYADMKPQSVEIISLNNDGWENTPGGWVYRINGICQTGWLQDNGKWYYLNESGIMHTGWLTIGDATYYLYPDGAMASGESLISGKAYTFSDNGAFLFEGIHRDGLENDLVTCAWEKTEQYQEEIRDMINRINQKRADHGLPPFVYDEGLTRVAMYRANHMGKHNYYSHYYNDTTGHVVNVSKHLLGRSGGMKENNNLVTNKTRPVYNSLLDSNPDSIQTLMNSAGHRDILLTTACTRVGIGYYTSPDFQKLILTQVFAPNW